ncbi:hypothetical protein [Falsigemmobacter faecalis]|uniref:Solute-binding protein family 3/N-terminal domain-containing protein n=1 Tax=Falsigemmobacter faecalis TaxID=2488730 RepID=A0A3P3D7H1_9RHOB|nr:hypothetical protein [Falsigemmobacter faecalis]RRH70303.1 hypothetical protein EG244_17085 [Falsigemmobacter faecalis]
MSALAKGWRRPLRDISLLAGFLAAVSFLPADTSLAERQASGQLRYCVADQNSPLIRDPAAGGPGPELRLMQAAAGRLGVQLRLVEVANIGRSFNPADWNLTRAQCDVLGGGLADSAANRGFMTLIPTGQQIALRRSGTAEEPPPGTKVGVFAGTAGLDRVRLSGFMRSRGWQPVPLRREADLRAWIAGGAPAIFLSLTPLPEGTAHHPLAAEAGEVRDLVFGLWRGDTTFTRAFREAISQGGDAGLKQPPPLRGMN